MLHHGFDRMKGKPYFSYGKKGKRFHYTLGDVRSEHIAKAKAMKHAHSMAIRGSALVAGALVGGELVGGRKRRVVRRRRPAIHRIPRMYM